MCPGAITRKRDNRALHKSASQQTSDRKTKKRPILSVRCTHVLIRCSSIRADCHKNTTVKRKHTHCTQPHSIILIVLMNIINQATYMRRLGSSILRHGWYNGCFYFDQCVAISNACPSTGEQIVCVLFAGRSAYNAAECDAGAVAAVLHRRHAPLTADCC